MDRAHRERGVGPRARPRRRWSGALCDRVEGEPSATSLGAARAIVEQLRRDAAQLGVPSDALRRRQLMGRIRRTTELGLLLLGGLIIGGTYTLASLGRTASLPADIVGFLGVVLGLLLVAHLAVRRLAPEADGLLLPLAGLLNGLGYVFIARTRRAAGRPAGRVDRHRARARSWSPCSSCGGCATWSATATPSRSSASACCCCRSSRRSARRSTAPASGSASGRSTSSPASPPSWLLALFLASYLVERRELLAVASLRVGPLSLPDPKHLGPLLAAWGDLHPGDGVPEGPRARRCCSSRSSS